MNGMIDRVTRAISGVFTKHMSLPPLGVDEHEFARAILQALREPTQEMLKAASETEGIKHVDDLLIVAKLHGCVLPKGDVTPLKQAWHAMIDEALKEN